MVAAAIFAVWLRSTGRHDDVLYCIHFPDSVSGFTVGADRFMGCTPVKPPQPLHYWVAILTRPTPTL